MIADETGYEGERRGCLVDSEDAVVRENVCLVILRIGRELLESLLVELAAPAGQTQRSHDQAA